MKSGARSRSVFHFSPIIPSPTLKLPIERRIVTIIAISLAFAVVSVLLLVFRWQVAPPGGVVLDLGDPNIAASHFYGVERSDTFSFRWSRTTSAVSLPALSTSQVISVSLDPARPSTSTPVYFRLSVGDQTLGSYRAIPGLNTYTATVAPGFGPDVRLIIDSDTFYPGADDRRKLGMAVSQIGTTPREGRAGLQLPPYLWLVVAALTPALVYLLVRPRRGEYGLVLGPIFTVVPTVWSLLAPPSWALPVATWAVGITMFALFMRKAYELSRKEGMLFDRLQSVGVSRWELPAVALFVGALAIAQTWPLVTRLSSSMPGWPMDNFAFLYKLWWFRTALTVQHTSPFFDPSSYAPFGFDLAQGEPTLANTLPGVIIGTVTNDVVSYNLLMLLSFVISGLGAYLLVRELTGSRLAALLSAVAFAFAPYHMAQMTGHLQLMGTGWIALSFYFLERTLKTWSWRDGALTGLMLSLTALSAWYYAYMVGLALLIYAVARVWMLRREINTRSLLMPAIAAGVVVLLLGGIAAIPSLRLWSEGELSHSAKAADESSASPLDYVVPSELQPLWGEASMRAHSDENLIESNLYLGLVVVGIAIGGWAIGRRGPAKPQPNRAGRVWLGLLIVTGILSLGLTLHGPNGQVKGPIPLPGQLLYDWLPFYSSMRAYARFGVLVSLASIVLMGIGWTAILGSRRRWLAENSRWLTLVAMCLLLADFWTAPPAYSWGTTRVEESETAKFLATQPPGIVMQMPVMSSQSGPLLYQHIYYGKPISYGYDTFEPPDWSSQRGNLLTFPDAKALDVLQAWGVRYVVVSSNAYGADWAGTLNYLNGQPRLKHLQDIQEQRTWDVDPEVLDAQPFLLQYVEPDTMSVFQLVY